MKNIEEINNDILEIKERNRRVELDKAWEVSWTRRIFIMILTFVFASLWLVLINENHVFLKAIVPVLGYLLSTLSIPQLKKIWIKAKL
jgi:hypothetical protein